MSPSSRCRFCDHENPNEARFCNACGSPLHLKPCPQCESVNDIAAEQCYECGASLESGAPVETNQPSATVAATSIEAAFEDAAPGHVPEAFGARLDDLPQLQGHENVAAAERRDAFMRRSRVSAAAFAVLVLLVMGAFGYYSYQHQAESESDVVAVSGQNEDRQPPAGPRQAAIETSDSANSVPTTESASSNTSTSNAAPDAKSVASEADAQTPPSADTKQSTPGKTAARSRPSTLRSPNKAETDAYRRPAPATDASAQATQRMIERYLGTRAGTSTQRSNQY